jgi:hypothetical protein
MGICQVTKSPVDRRPSPHSGCLEQDAVGVEDTALTITPARHHDRWHRRYCHVSTGRR